MTTTEQPIPERDAGVPDVWKVCDRCSDTMVRWEHAGSTLGEGCPRCAVLKMIEDLAGPVPVLSQDKAIAPSREEVARIQRDYCERRAAAVRAALPALYAAEALMRFAIYVDPEAYGRAKVTPSEVA